MEAFLQKLGLFDKALIICDLNNLLNGNSSSRECPNRSRVYFINDILP
jgi:hypothetical protein